ncbi:MAG: hypothetical protein QF463_10945 [Vicinamibacterales bacterium]|nr:hypothetical protein [Vicinamibacterales bacterium]MQG70523.1 hypothetical protein [SAR202 cluster bacterium]MDP6609571.1 hypothetical protein [Vicinamibacterales bacterium]MDP7339077.1 hypothetical protein [Vicinamibacterales bacterium]MDP7472550.1 hypothetical protein [Vicinamibacterales bacterium]|tara:strand:- start:4926 stop:5132 length:207 start_codon:yes stop_codon:yes gene_type:complete
MSSSLAGSRDPGCGRGFQPGRVAAACDQLQLLRQQLVSATQEVNVLTPQVAQAKQQLLAAEAMGRTLE